MNLLTVILVPVLLFGLFRLFEWKSLYYPTRSLDVTPSDVDLAFEEVNFVAEDGVRLHGWWIPGESGKGTILFCHGNGGNISHRVGWARELHETGWNLFLFDYRGYGKSRGFPTEKGTYRDARAAYEVIRARYDDIEQPPVVVLGRSLGGAVAVQLALDKPVLGLVLENTFPSVPEMARELYPFLPRPLIKFRYDAASKIDDLALPKLIAHSPHDEIVPYDMGRKLFDVAADPKAFAELKGGHNDTAWLTPGYPERFQGFLDLVHP